LLNFAAHLRTLVARRLLPLTKPQRFQRQPGSDDQSCGCEQDCNFAIRFTEKVLYTNASVRVYAFMEQPRRPGERHQKKVVGVMAILQQLSRSPRSRAASFPCAVIARSTISAFATMASVSI